MTRISAALLTALMLTCAPVAQAAGAKDGIKLEEPIDPLAKKITGSKNYVSMFGIRASVTAGFTVSGFIAVDAGLDIEDSRMRKQLKAIKPRVKDAMRGAVASYANGPYKIGEAPNLDMLRARMQRAVDKQLGKGVAKVLLASVIVFEDE